MYLSEWFLSGAFSFEIQRVRVSLTLLYRLCACELPLLLATVAPLLGSRAWQLSKLRCILTWVDEEIRPLVSVLDVGSRAGSQKELHLTASTFSPLRLWKPHMPSMTFHHREWAPEPFRAEFNFSGGLFLLYPLHNSCGLLLPNYCDRVTPEPWSEVVLWFNVKQLASS